MVALSKIAAQSDASWPKWQVALIVTVPVAFGLGYLYYKKKVKEATIKIKTETVKIEENNVKDKREIVSEEKSKLLEKPKPLSPVQRAEELKNQGNAFFKEGNYTEAIRCYTEAIELCPKYESHTMATFYQNRAAANEKLENVGDVIADCSEALKLNQRYLKAIIRRAKAGEKSENFELALEDLATAGLIESFQNEETIRDLDRVAQISGKKKGEEYLTTQRPKLPSKFFIKTYLSTFTHGTTVKEIDEDDENNDLLRLYHEAKSCLLNGKCDETEEKCGELIEKAEQRDNNTLVMEGRLLLGTLYTLSKQNAKAIRELTTIIDNADAHPKIRVNALIKRATVNQHLGDSKKCEEDFEKAKEIDPENADIYHHYGQINLIVDKLEESVNNFRKAVALDPDFPVAAIQHCFVEYKYAAAENDQKKVDYYFRQFEKIIHTFPDSIECVTLYAQVLAEKQDYQNAEHLYDVVIEKEPTHAALYVHKALLLLQWKADVDQAKKLIKHAIKLDPDCEFAYETMGTIEMQTGNFESAAKYFALAIPRYSSNDELFHLCSIYNTCTAQAKATSRLGISAGAPPDFSFVN